MGKIQIKVPFNKDGNQVTYYDNWDIENNRITLKDNYEFAGVLKYAGYSRGRSALNIKWKDKDGHTYESGMSLLNDVLSGDVPPNVEFSQIDGVLAIIGTYTFRKQGTSVLLILSK